MILVVDDFEPNCELYAYTLVWEATIGMRSVARSLVRSLTLV
jgi:hypothetical protein